MAAATPKRMRTEEPRLLYSASFVTFSDNALAFGANLVIASHQPSLFEVIDLETVANAVRACIFF